MNRIKAVRGIGSTGFFTGFTLAALALLLSASGAKGAGCALPYEKAVATPIPFVSPHGDDTQESEDSTAPTPIVGLWHLLYTATSVPISIPQPPFSLTPPFLFLESFKTWHADGTEFENAFLPPDGGNVCFGVWKNIGHGVSLHHVGLMFGGPGAMPPEDVSNIFTVDETDTVAANGKTYTGFFDFKLYAPSACANGASGYVCAGTPVAEVKGTTYGVRINVD
jgi:hypothetical protein